jgi:flagellar basal-body rod protein FlgB
MVQSVCNSPLGAAAFQELPIMLDRLTDTLNFQADALSLRSERQRLIASNIANADTPGYLARDMDFATALRQASGEVKPVTLATSSSAHLSPDLSARSGGELLYASASMASIDRNTVDMDRERASFTDNAVKYEATLRFINSGVSTMLSAIKGQ